MDERNLLSHLVKEIDKLRADQITALASGRLSDHAEYRHICGVIRGLSLAESLITDLVQRMERLEDE